MQIGNYKIQAVNSGSLGLDGGAMFGIIPKPLWEKTNPADASNRVKLATRNLLLRSSSRNILIDTGMGNKWDEKSEEIYDIQQQPYAAVLTGLGLKPAEITDVILTHLHFDHTGGSTIMKNGKLIPAFPNAKYYVQRKNFEWADSPSEKDKGSYIKDNFIPLRQEGVLHFFDGRCMFDDEIELIPVHGHTFWQQLVKISDASNTILYCGDLFPFTSHIPIPYIMSYDLQPMVTLQEKKTILKQAVEENWKLCFEHDPETAIATVQQTEKGIRVNEKFNTL